MRKHVDRLNFPDRVFRVEQVKVARLGRGVAADVDNPARLGCENGPDHVVVHARPGRVGDDHVGMPVLADEPGGQDILHVARVKVGVGDLVQGRVDLRVLDRLGDILDADHLAGPSRDEVGDGPGPGIEVVDGLRAGQSREIQGDLIQLVRLLAVGLVERFGADLEFQLAHRLDDVVLPLVEQDLLVGDRIVAFPVDDVHQRGDLRETPREMVEQGLAPWLVLVEEGEHHHQVARRRRADHQRPHESLLRAQVEEGISLVRQAIILDRQADLVGDVVLQPALVYVEHLVEHAGNVEPDPVHLLERLAGKDLLLRQPFLVGEGELQLVAVEPR